jgi:hypothetical protein
MWIKSFIMNLLRYVFLLIFLNFLSSCTFEDKERTDMIMGTWQGTEWFVEGELREFNMANVHFNFQSGNRYEAQLGAREEVGTFRIYEDKLYTQDGAAAQIMTNIEKLTADSLVINMNRGGQREQLILVRTP